MQRKVTLSQNTKSKRHEEKGKAVERFKLNQCAHLRINYMTKISEYIRWDSIYF